MLLLTRNPRGLFFVFAVLVGILPILADEVPPQIRVLYLSSFGSDSADTLTVVESLRKGLVSLGFRPEVYVESLDTYRLPANDVTRQLVDDILDRRYSALRFNIILAQASEALRIAAGYRERVGYQPPVFAFDWIDDVLIDKFSGAEGFFGRPLKMSFPPTLDLAVTLFPRAQTAYLLVSPLDQNHLPMFQEDLALAQAAHPRVRLVPLVNQSFEVTCQVLSESRGDAVALLLPGEWLLGTGEFLGGQAAQERLAEASPLPYFGITRNSFGSGLVGGIFADREEMGKEAALVVGAIVAGSPGLVRWQNSDSLVPTLDDRALLAYRVPPDLVAPGTTVLFSPPPFWVRYELPLKILGVSLAILVIILLVVIWGRWQERRTLLQAKKALERAVEQRTAELTLANQELRSSNDHLEKALVDLKEAEERMVVSEKHAALSRLTANISHELNSPLAAITSSASSITDYLGHGLKKVFDAPVSLDQDSSRFFYDVLIHTYQGRQALGRGNPRAERQARDQVERLFREAGLESSHTLAEEFVELGVADFASRAVPLLVDARAETFLAILRATLGALRAAIIIEESVSKASRLVASMGTYAPGADGSTSGDVDLALIVDEVLGFFNLRAYKNLEVLRSLGATPSVAVPREDLIGILFPLLKNAIQATQGVGRVDVSAEAAGPVVQIHIADTGGGIPDAIKSRIFEPFFSTRPMGEGAGVGLDVARRLARKHGGEVAFDSRPGQTVFTVVLPLADKVRGETPDGS